MAGFAIDAWMKAFTERVQALFGERLWFVGLQGSYGRGEASKESDIDTVVILEEISPEDFWAYGRMLDELPNREKACGFFSGKKELLNWEPSDLFQFYSRGQRAKRTCLHVHLATAARV